MIISEDIINKAVEKAINEVILGQNDSFTPYSKDEREQNFKGLRQMRNTAYDEFMKWKKQQMMKGRPKKELSWNTYLKEN